ncbi:Histone deacetylase-like amidohydrolase [Legionella lansingensis]|uniref:Histone deacetylase-like amidohydrolase n=1 Tax=Legionella lansingensis TaxID=45067 RepID=A0A0W0VK07_9GAMM|nr:histone deacetylase family protein [Legionella lansingensis]KTD20424.1 Histone deacetylase-like amidohydrolase [Legionella lansingensis]SNV50021.1 Histone deacetylase-like amidohydrolase [Legionella lansingensis]
MQIGFISHKDCLLHDMGDFHPEQPDRLRSIEQAVKASDLNKVITYYEAPLATREQLLRVHDEEYVDFIFKIAPSQGLVPLDPDVWMNPHSLQAALRAAGAVVYGVELILKNEIDAAFCNVRPPGHHAERNKAMGFCIFNNVALGVAHALEQLDLERVAIVDFDVHHGNGTEDIFKRDERVLYCSTFQHPFYPFRGANTQEKNIINIPLPAYTTGKTYREHVEKLWFKQIEDFSPDMIFFSAGFDAYYKDELANLLLTPDDYLWITQKVKQIADKTSNGRMLSVLEGGYNLQGLGECAVAHLHGLLS